MSDRIYIIIVFVVYALIMVGVFIPVFLRTNVNDHLAATLTILGIASVMLLVSMFIADFIKYIIEKF